MVARDLEGTWYWLLEEAGDRFLGPMSELVVEEFRDALTEWQPWTDPDWPPQA